MILINTDRSSIILLNPKPVYDRLKVRNVKLREIIDDENAPQLMRDCAHKELLGYQEDIQNLNKLLKAPFDVLIVIEKEATSEITEIIDDFSDDLSAWAPTQE